MLLNWTQKVVRCEQTVCLELQHKSDAVRSESFPAEGHDFPEVSDACIQSRITKEQLPKNIENVHPPNSHSIFSYPYSDFCSCFLEEIFTNTKVITPKIFTITKVITPKI